MASPLPAAKVKAFLTAVKSELESLLNTAPLQQQHDRREISPTTGAPPPAAAAAAQATDANTPNAPPLRFEQLLQLQVWVLNLELLQRGNVKVLASTSGAASDVNVTLGLVRETSGKEVMSPSGGDPVRNLQSNVSILQGRVAEAIVTADPQQQSKLSSSSSSSSDVVDAALLSQVQARCREVQDDRFLSLLLLLSSALAANASPPPPGAPPSSSTSAFDDTQVLAWSYVAEGCYGRAGILAQTNPPPFKAAWDVVVQRNTRRCKDHDGEPEHPWEALDWIGHLRRIAAGRNNHKKVSELSLTVLELCLPIPSLEDFLSDDPESTKQPPAPLFKARAQSTTSASPSSSLLATVQKAFVTPVRSMDPPTPQAVLDMCEEQLRYLKKHHQSDNPDDDTGGDASFRLAVQTCMYHLLWTLQNHDRAVEADGQARHVAAMNRRASAADKVSSKSSSVQSSSSSSAVLTLEECLRQARTDFFQLMADDEEYVQTFFEKGGVDALLEAMQRASSVPRSTHKVPAEGATGQGAEPTAEAAGEMAHRVVASFLSSWHRDYLQARMLQRHRRQTKLNGDEVLSVALMEWTQRTISNLLRGWHGPNEASPKSADTPPIWVVMLATMVPELEWMLQHVLSISDAHLFPIDVHRAAQNVLQSVFDSAVPSPSLTSESLVVRDTNSSSRLSLLQWANRSLQATLYLSQQADEGASLVNLPALLSEPMAGSSQPHSAARSGRFGTDFYELAVVWNGLHTTVHWPYCVTPEARIVVERARTSLEWAEKHWGRPTSDVEGWILKIALADAEGGARIAGSSFSSTGGLVGLAKALYEHVLNEIDSANEAGKVGFPLRALLKSKCFSGLVNVSLHSSLGADRVLEFLPEDDLRTPEGLSRRNLDLILQVLKASDTMSWAPLRIFGSSPQSVERAFRLQVAYVRNQVADCLIRKSLVEEAGVFLQEAVVASPDDPGATLALGAFRLRLMFLDSADPHRNAAKAAQIQLLKAAKLDASKSSPFALLGYWYEYMKDEKRALGCYSKALLLDPWHPVAGRGITRLQPRETVLQLLQKATDSGSPFSGWAWKALGVHKAMVEGSDDLAVVCLLQALRCADVASPTGSDLSVFFASPFQSKEAGDYELVDTLAELAECYRRLGRFTASLRSYNKALDIAAFQGPPRPSLLLSCAQVEMELGLFDEAADKLSQAMDLSEDRADRWHSAHGLGLCLLSMAKRDHQHGKAGLALQHLQRGIDAYQQVDLQFGCVLKVLGDLHSLGALLPPDVFSESDVDSEERTIVDEESMIRRQLAFVESGVKAYEGAEAAIRGATDEERQATRSSLAADIGSNLLLQAQLVSLWHGKGLDEMASPETEKLLERAEKEFRRSIDLSPAHGAAWCGLGCAVHKFDPLLAQHAFCRSIELDPMFPEPYANLSFLYTRCGVLAASEQVSMALTQVADTPMMWMNRALLLERHEPPDRGSAAAGNSSPFEQAADAYRAALQVAPLPTAKYGLALTCRRRRRAAPALERVLADESHCLLGEYRDATGNLDVASRTFGGIATIERGATEPSHSSFELLLEAGRRQVLSALERLDDADDERDGDLDKQIIQTVIGMQPDLSSAAETARTRADGLADANELQRQLHLDPTRGDLWLALAKALVRGNPDVAVAPTASLSLLGAAADKACHILDAQARDPASRRDKHQVVSARLLSEALALRFWLGTVGSSDTDDEARSSLSTADLQRALMLCPDNAMAREALALVGGLR